MSMYAQFDENGSQEQIASNGGWELFGTWVDGLDVEKYPAVVGLWEHGHSPFLDDVREQLGKALTESALDDDTRVVAERLPNATGTNRAAKVLRITNGVRTDDDAPDEGQLELGETVAARARSFEARLTHGAG